jgi:carbon-monoxide dehydrogenase small subunit
MTSTCQDTAASMTETTIHLVLNGQPYALQCAVRTSLADCIRHGAGLTGTHVGCEHGVCGACTVVLNGDAVRSCLMLGVQANGAAITTIEGLCDGDALGPLQQAFRKHHALQCGFCTPGFLTTAHALLSREPDADRERIREVLSGNICRCTGYMPIVEAVAEAASAYQRPGS